MKNFIGTKKVKAEPMNEQTAVEMGFARTNTDNHEWRPGYHVQYENPDGTTYDSWSPKDVFEKAYKIAETYEDRIKIEIDELKERLSKLNTFLYSEEGRKKLGSDLYKLRSQKSCMENYLEILLERLVPTPDEKVCGIGNKCAY